MRNDILYERLHNCLQTILELEQTFSDASFNGCGELRELFAMLKDSLDKLGKLDYEAADVDRIEQAVAVFLQAIKPTFHGLDKKLYSGRVLQ